MDFGYRPYLRKKFKKIELAPLGLYIVLAVNALSLFCGSMAFLFKFLSRLQQVKMLFLNISARFIRINR
jgi:hypothetical protein